MNRFIVFTLASLVGMAASSLSAVDLAVRGRVAAPIVIAADASPCEKFAAEEFANYVNDMTGVKPNVVAEPAAMPRPAIVIGRTKFAAKEFGTGKFVGDGFRVVAKSGRVFVLAGRKRGVMYGTFDVLERFGGVAWLAAKRTVVPRLNKFVVPDHTDYTEKPAFCLRDTLWWDANRDNTFGAHMRLNGKFVRLPDEFGGHVGKFDSKLNSCHTFLRLVPVDRYYDAHPEYFSEVKGKRVRLNPQLCLSNPDVLRIVTDGVLARIREDPSSDFYGVSQEDWDSYCTCPNCAAIDAEEGSPAGSIIRFVNKVAEAVEKEFPNKMVETLAYHYSRKPPKTRPRRNVLICLCSDHVDVSRPLADTKSELNSTFAEYLRGWGKLTRNIYVWDYTTNFGHYLNTQPNTPYLGANLRFYRDAGVSCIFEQGNGLGPHADFGELKTYLLAKYMWNPDQDEKKLLDTFFSGYYGAGAPFARACYDLANALPHEKPLSMRDLPDTPWITDEFLTKTDALWQKACEATKGDPAANEACRMGRAGIVYTILWRNQKNIITAWCTRTPEKFRPRVNRLFEKTSFFGQCLRECPQIRLVENVNRCATEDRLFRTITATGVPSAGSDLAEIPSGTMHQVWEWISMHQDGCTRYEQDEEAKDGWAMWLNPLRRGDALNFYLNEELAYDPGVDYRLRVRARIEPASGEATTDEAFRAFVYNDRLQRVQQKIRTVLVSEANPTGYAWYDVITFKPEKGDRIVVQAGNRPSRPGGPNVWVDRFEISAIRR